MSAPNIDTLLDLWASTLLKHNEPPPFANYKDLYNTIDSTPLGDVAWQSFSLRYNGDEDPGHTLPQWMTSEYEVWFRDPHAIVKSMIDNPDYNHHTDVAPVRIFNSDGQRVYQNFMSGDWAWEEAVSKLKLFFFVLTFDTPRTGPNCRRPDNSWFHARSHHPRKRQNHCLCCNRPQRVLPTLSVHWLRPQ